MRKRAFFLAAVLGLSALTGCEETPDTAIVRQKGTAGEKYQEAKVSMEETEDQENPLRARTGAPGRYTAEFASDDGRLTVSCDAAVELPAAKSVGTYQVTQSDMTEEKAAKFAEVFAGGELYDMEAYSVTTKAEAMEKLSELKGYQAKGNLDPYGYGTDENGVPLYDLTQEIEAWEEICQDAPEEKERIPVETGALLNEDGSLSGVSVERQDGSRYLLYYKQEVAFPYLMELQTDTGGGRDPYSWQQAEGNETVSMEEALAMAGMTEEEATAAAEEKVDALGIPGMEPQAAELALHRSGDDFSQYASYDMAGWIIHFTRTIDGVPVTYDYDQGGGLEDMDSTMTPWGYEWMQVVVNKDGVQEAQCYNIYDIGEKTTENAELKSFSEIAQIFQDMMLIQNADMSEKKLSYEIDRITFGYCRIFDPGKDARSGILVPVWDFYGTFSYEAEYDGEVSTGTGGQDGMTSFLTINAIDGSIINRSVGY